MTFVDLDRLVGLAVRGGFVVELALGTGAFAARGQPHLRAAPRDRIDDAARSAIRRCFYVEFARTTDQYLEFALQQLVEVALRAMSPSINDPFTAIRCVDRLEAGLRRLCGRVPPSSTRSDAAGVVRIVIPWLELPAVIGVMFDPLREAGRNSALLLLRLVTAVTSLAAVAPDEATRRALARQLDALRSRSEVLPPLDQARFLRPAERAQTELDEARHGQRVDPSCTTGPD